MKTGTAPALQDRGHRSGKPGRHGDDFVTGLDAALRELVARECRKCDEVR